MEQQNKRVIDAFKTIKEGEILTFHEGDISISSLRTYAGMLNSMAGYTKFSISRDRLMQVVRVKYNEK